MSNLTFLKGSPKSLPTNNIQKNTFYLTDDSYNFYYGKTQQDLIKLFGNPETRIKEIKTYYSKIAHKVPQVYPPPSELWTTEEPTSLKDNETISQFNCIIYMDDHYEYSIIEQLISTDEIDAICSLNKKGTSLLNKAVLGQMVLNTEEVN